MKYHNSELLNQIDLFPSMVTVSEIKEAISELESCIKNNFGVPFKHKGTDKAQENMNFLQILLVRAIEHEKRCQIKTIKSKLDKRVNPNVIIKIMNNFKDIDESLEQYQMLLASVESTEVQA